MKTGLVSITFRKHSVDEIINISKEAGIDGIEWGGDVHVPHGDIKIAKEVRIKTLEAGLEVAAYGSYFKFEEGNCTFLDVLNSAVALGAPVIRVWAGSKGSKEFTKEEYDNVITQVREAGTLSAEKGIKLTFEYHGNSLTDTNESAAKFLSDIGHDNVYSNWQPHVGQTVEQNLKGIDLIENYLACVHVFYWEPDFNNKRSLQKGFNQWSTYIGEISKIDKNRWFLIEFVEDGTFDNFLSDAKTLKEIVKAVR